jgi:hypothetical protein
MSARLITLLLALSLSAAVLADDADPPSRVARLSLIQGDVSFQASGSGAPEQAELNRPLTWGDRLLTERGSRAEMSVGTAAIRFDESTDLSIANLDEDIVQLELNSGTLGIHVRELGEGETFEVDTPNAAVLLRKPGDYRIEVDSQSATVLAVRNGEAELDGGTGPIRLGDEQELRFTGSEQIADVAALGPLTDFDEWCIERERILADQQTSRYVSRDVVGYEDLDRYGSWYSEPGYGYVWAPTYISVGWAPYRFGHWAWIGPWGFTWIDHAPWGYAPFHYGRWAHVRHRWCWVPGPRHFRPVWAPALVGWHGMPGVRDPSRPGSVSWFPLGPRDVYVPTHHASPRYVRAVNVSNTTIDNNTQITNAWRGRLRDPRFANREVPGAMTSLPSGAFINRVRGGRVMQVAPSESGRDISHLATSQAPPRDSHWRELASPRNPQGNREARGPYNTFDSQRNSMPRTSFNSGDNEPRVGDQRRSVPRTPPDRRVIQGLNDGGRPASDPSGIRRFDQPPKRALDEARRAVPAESWQQSRGARESRSFTPNAHSDSGRGGRGDVSRTGGGRVERSGSGGESHMSGGRAQSGQGGGYSGNGGRSQMSGSRSQSGRGGGLSSRP